MPQVKKKSFKGGGVEVIDYDKKKNYKFSNAQRAMGTSIFEGTHHDINGRSLSINDQPNWLTNNELTFDISNEKLLNGARMQLESGPAINAGSRRRRRPSRKFKKSSKRVFRKKSRSTRRR